MAYCWWQVNCNAVVTVTNSCLHERRYNTNGFDASSTCITEPRLCTGRWRRPTINGFHLRHAVASYNSTVSSLQAKAIPNHYQLVFSTTVATKHQWPLVSCWSHYTSSLWRPSASENTVKNCNTTLDRVWGTGHAYFSRIACTVADNSDHPCLRSAEGGNLFIPRTRTTYAQNVGPYSWRGRKY